MQPILSMSTWTSLSSEQRNRIRVIFSIPRSSHVIVNDGRIETDGTTPKDFESLTVEKMKKYLSDESNDFYNLFDKVIAKVTEELLRKPTPIKLDEIVTIPEGVPLTIVIEPKEPKNKTKKKIKKNANETK